MSRCRYRCRCRCRCRCRTVLALLAILGTAACAATPAEQLGTIPPRRPVTAAEQAKTYGIVDHVISRRER